MLGDNLYSGSGPRDYQKKFEQPYKALLASGLKFYAALGNHDNPDERNYKPFNMGGQRYYTFKPQKGIYYFPPGGAAKLREGDVSTKSQLTAKSFDTGYHFMLIELTKDAL